MKENGVDEWRNKLERKQKCLRIELVAPYVEKLLVFRVTLLQNPRKQFAVG